MAKGKKPIRRKKTPSNIHAISQDIKAIEAQKKALRKKQREMLKRQGSDIRDFRHSVAKLKKAGIVSKRTDARSQEATAYMRQKVRDFFGVIVGTEQAVAVPKSTRQQYKDSGTVKMKGRFAIVPKEDKDQIARIRKGDLIEITTPVGRAKEGGPRPAYMREVILPFKMTHMHIVAEKLANDPTMDGLKEPGELFGARIFGHNISQGLGYPSADELGDYILKNYQHLMKGTGDRKSVKYFRLFKFWNRSSTLPEGAEIDKDFKTDYRKKKKGDDRRGRMDHMYKQRLERNRARKKKDREKETEIEREKRLIKQRERQAALRSKPSYKRPDTKG